MPLGAMMARKEVMTWTGGTHGSTCGGNPVCIAAALATVELLETALCENSTRVGAFLKDRLTQNLMGKHGVIDVRGLGLMIGVEFDSAKKSSAVANLCYQRGLLVLECGTKAIRLSPPLVITQEQAATAADVFIAACKDVSAKP
jgi:4-aminobutyrate aminotransferase